LSLASMWLSSRFSVSLMSPNFDALVACTASGHSAKDSLPCSDVTSQDFIKFWGIIFFAFVLLEMIEISQGFKTFESIWKLY
jgi:hypothetical protein